MKRAKSFPPGVLPNWSHVIVGFRSEVVERDQHSRHVLPGGPGAKTHAIWVAPLSHSTAVFLYPSDVASLSRFSQIKACLLGVMGDG